MIQLPAVQHQRRLHKGEREAGLTNKPFSAWLRDQYEAYVRVGRLANEQYGVPFVVVSFDAWVNGHR